MTSFSGDDIDNILDEIDDIERKQAHISQGIEANDEVLNWDEIKQQLKVKNINFIKNLITSKEIDVNSKNPTDGKTLLIYAVIIGDLELVTVICNFGGDVHVKDNDNLDALDYAIKYSRYKITELVYYQQLSGKLGNDLKNISVEIHAKHKELAHIHKLNHNLGHEIINFMIKAIKARASFDEAMLFYAWCFVLKTSKKEETNPLDHELWTTMMKVYEEILSNTTDKRGWRWLKEKFINSLIWYLPHPKKQTTDSKQDKMENVLQTTLFYELLTRVRAESKTQSDLLLKEKINRIKKQKPDDWKQLCSYNMVTKYSANARQDVCGCLVPKYNEYDLVPTTYFSAKKHYDTNIYLNELIFRANILDSMFQFEMKSITNAICQQTGHIVTYRAGAVKTLTRSQIKINNDYINAKFPTSAKILDINRCALQFKTIQQMMKFIEIFTDKVTNKETRCIESIVRCKNGWSAYDHQYPQYTDIKLNVLLNSPDEGMIVAEIQFLLDLMSSFKKKAHKLYSVERKFELVLNFAALTKQMDTFKDFDNNDMIFKQLIIEDDVKYFKDLWENIIIDSKSLTNNIIYLLSSRTCKIHKYLHEKYVDVYRQSILFCINFVSEAWESLLNIIGSNEMDKNKFIQQFINLFIFKKISNYEEGLQMLRSFGILLSHDISSYVEHNTLTTPLYDRNEHIFLHKNTTFKVIVQPTKSAAGSLHMFGGGEYGALGLGEAYASEDATLSTPVLINQFNANLVQIASHNHHLALNDNGDIYWWGKNPSHLMMMYNQYMHNKATVDDAAAVGEYIHTPQILPSFTTSKAVHVAVGDDHSLILTDDGNVYSFGSGTYGQLGHGAHRAVSQPKLIETLQKDYYITHISCGESFSCVISKDGKLLCFGENHYGQCGLGTLTEGVYKPTQVQLSDEWIPLYTDCGGKHTLLLTTSGSVLSWGHNPGGQLGHGDEKNRTKPEVIKTLTSKKIVDVACGGWRCLCVTDFGEVYSWGLGTLGHGDVVNEPQVIPKIIQYFDEKHIKIISCECGPHHSGVITSDNELYLWGDGTRGQLGLGDDRLVDQICPTKVEYFNDKSIQAISLGETCTAVITKNECDDDEKTKHEQIYYMRENEQIQISNEIKEDVKSTTYKVLIKNESLFGHNEWILLTQSCTKGFYF